MNKQITIKNSLKLAAILLVGLLLANFNPAYSQTATCQTFDFNLASEYAAGSDSYTLTLADFNGDGIVDVATPNISAQTVSVMSGDGAGGYAPPRAFRTNAEVRNITVGDLNRDGKPDLIGESYFGSVKLIVLLNDGQGGFAAPVSIPLPSSFNYFFTLKAVDFNGDGNPDVVAVNETGIHLFLGNGQGGLAFAASLALIGNRTSEIVVGNFNNDNIADVAVVTGTFGTLWDFGLILGRTDGGFAFHNRYSLDNQPSSFVIGEFNGDGLTDVAIAANYPYANLTPPTYTLQPWFGNGAGNFTAGAKIFLPFRVYGMATGDFNADGKQDLAASLGSQTATVNGNGDGTFQSVFYWATPPSDRLLSVDANRDGKTDLLSIRSGHPQSFLSVLLSSGGGFLAPKAIAYGGTDIAAADFNNDNLPDMVTVTDTSFGSPSNVVIALNSANGLGLPDRSFSMPIAMRALAVGDFNGDGNKDVITAHSSNGRVYAVRLGDGTGNLGAAITQQWFNGVENLVVGDFNNDGKDDFLLIDGTRGYTRLSNGNGTFSGVTAEYNFDSLDPLMVPQKGDFNHDGKLDLIISNGTTAKIWLGVGDGNFTLSDSQPFAAWRITVGDLNGDGILDVIGFNATGNETTLMTLLVNANGTFGAPFSGTIPLGSAAQIISGDFNADGFADVAYRASNYNNPINLIIIPSTGQAPYFGTPTFHSIAAISQYPFDYGTEASPITAADYNADGKVDIGFTSTSARAVIYNTSSQKPCVSINDVTVTEGDTGTTNATFTVSLSAPSSQIIRVNYALAGQTATVGTDLPNLSGRLEIPAGQTSVSLSIPIAGDLLDEFDETFLVNLSSAAHASIADSTGLGTIIDNDAAPTLTIDDVSKTEGISSQQYVFRINLSAPSGKPISFRYETADGTAVAGRDYMTSSFTHNLAPGLTTADAYVTVLGDNIFERDETFLVNISNATNLTLTDAQAQGTIVNDDTAPTISVLPPSAVEGDTDLVERSVTVQLSNPSYLPVTVNFTTSDATAVAGRDYITNNGSLTVEPEQPSVTFNVQIVGDTINEPVETFNIAISNPINGSISSSQAQFSIFDDEFINSDFDRDGKTDFAVFRPSNGTWYMLFSSNGSFSGIQYGASEDVPVSGDYNGDGRTDIAVWRPSSGSWFVRGINRSQIWGISSDKPVAGDYDNDGLIDVAVFRPSNAVWYINQSSNNTMRAVQFGVASDIPVPADYDGDGKTDIAVYRPGTGTWYILRSRDGNLAAAQFGVATDKPVAADYDGDGRADIAVFRDGIWHFLRSSDNTPANFQWGQAGDKPVPGNYDGDDKADFAVYREGVWYVFQSSNSTIIAKQFGASADIPIPFVSNN